MLIRDQKQLPRVVLIVALGVGCSSTPIDELELLGEYVTERTVIVTGIGEPDGEGCGSPQAPVSGDGALRYKVERAGEKVRVTELVGGCVLQARIEDDVVVADGSACALADAAPLRQLGVASRVYTAFRLDPRRKTVATRAVTVGTVTTGESHSCTVTEERIIDEHAASLDTGSLFRYAGSLVTTVDQPDTEGECGPEYLTFDTSGYLSIDAPKRSARLEGFGCGIGLDEPDGSKLSAGLQPCVVDGVASFRGVGLDRLELESFSLDPEGKTATWHARAWRTLPTKRVSYCFKLTGSVEQR
jgi:hypothetical protein